jgi:hypothetical protein
MEARWGEITLRFPTTANQHSAARHRDSLHVARGDSALYGWTIADHSPQYPAFNIEVSTLVLKLNPAVFDYLTVDSRRQGDDKRNRLGERRIAQPEGSTSDNHGKI